MARVALYARYSADNQSVTSIEDQFRICREHAARAQWMNGLRRGQPFWYRACSPATGSDPTPPRASLPVAAQGSNLNRTGRAVPV